MKPHSLWTVSLLVSALALPACGKKEPAKQPVEATPKAEAAAPKQPDAPPAPPPPPEIGLPLEKYVEARTMQLCAEKHGLDQMKAKWLGVGVLAGRSHPVDLDAALPKAEDAKAAPAAKPAKAEAAKADAAKPAEAPADPKAPPVLPAPTAEDEGLAQRFAAAHPLIDAHAPTKQRIDAAVEKCLYAPEIGLVSDELIERYSTTFVQVACLQRQMVDANGKGDPLAQAQIAAKIFSQNQFTAAEFSRYGFVFARFQPVQAKVHKAKAEACPDPREAEHKVASSGRWSGAVSGPRNGALTFAATDGKLEGSVQWQGANVKAADGAAEPQALALTGTLSDNTLSLFGQDGLEWVRLSGKADDKGGFSGSWEGAKADGKKLSGSWRSDSTPDAAAAPAAAPAGAPAPAAAPAAPAAP